MSFWRKRKTVFVILVSSTTWVFPAWGQTQSAVVYDPKTGIVQMFVFPQYDSELNDPSFNPPGMVQQRVSNSLLNGKLAPNVLADPTLSTKQQIMMQQAPIPLKMPPPCQVNCDAGAAQ